MERWRLDLYASELYHHGIRGQKWGSRNGPPYPLDRKTHEAVVRQKERSVKKGKASLLTLEGGTVAKVALSMLGPAGVLAGSVIEGAASVASLGIGLSSSIDAYKSGADQARSDYVKGNREANIAARKAYSGKEMVKSSVKNAGLSAARYGVNLAGSLGMLAIGGIPGAAVLAGSSVVNILLGLKQAKVMTDFESAAGENITYRRLDRQERREEKSTSEN